MPAGTELRREFRLYIATPPEESQRGEKVSWPCLRRETHYFPVSKVLLLAHLGSRDLASNLTHHLEKKSVNEGRQKPPKKNSGLNGYFPRVSPLQHSSDSAHPWPYLPHARSLPELGPQPPSLLFSQGCHLGKELLMRVREAPKLDLLRDTAPICNHQTRF